MNPTNPKTENPANQDTGGDCPSAHCSACVACGSQSEPYFSRIEPMGYFCPDCGHEDGKPYQPEVFSSPSCSLCGGKGRYMYDHNHWKPCEQCCMHSEGWWELTENHAGYLVGADNGCCRAGCGKLRRELHQANVDVRRDDGKGLPL